MISKNDDVLVSIIMPNYNSQEFIGSAICSVLGQSYQNFELLIIDDASTDDSSEVVKSFSDSRIILIEKETNSGVAESRNIGIDASRGEYIAFIDSDDLWEEKKLEKQLKTFHELGEGCAVLSCSVDLVDDTGINIGVRSFPDKVELTDMLKRNVVVMSSSLVRRDSLGGIQFRGVYHEDFCFWIEVLMKNGGSVYVDRERLATYRIRSGSLSSSKLKSQCWHYLALRELGFTRFKSLYCTFFGCLAKAFYIVPIFRARS